MQKVSESKDKSGKQLPAKREKRTMRNIRNTRDKSKDRVAAADSNGCAVLEEQNQRKQDITVTIFKHADDFAHA